MRAVFEGVFEMSERRTFHISLGRTLEIRPTGRSQHPQPHVKSVAETSETAEHTMSFHTPRGASSGQQLHTPRAASSGLQFHTPRAANSGGQTPAKKFVSYHTDSQHVLAIKNYLGAKQKEVAKIMVAPGTKKKEIAYPRKLGKWDVVSFLVILLLLIVIR